MTDGLKAYYNHNNNTKEELKNNERLCDYKPAKRKRVNDREVLALLNSKFL